MDIHINDLALLQEQRAVQMCQILFGILLGLCCLLVMI